MNLRFHRVTIRFIAVKRGLRLFKRLYKCISFMVLRHHKAVKYYGNSMVFNCSFMIFIMSDIVFRRKQEMDILLYKHYSAVSRSDLSISSPMTTIIG